MMDENIFAEAFGKDLEIIDSDLVTPLGLMAELAVEEEIPDEKPTSTLSQKFCRP